MEIRTVHDDPLPLLSLLYPGEAVQPSCLEQGALFALYDGELKSVALVTREEEDTVAIRKLVSTGHPEDKCYASRMVMYLLTHYQGHGRRMIVDPRQGAHDEAFYGPLGFVRTRWNKEDERSGILQPPETEVADMTVLSHAL